MADLTDAELDSLVEHTKSEARKIRTYEGIPVRVFGRNGRVVWSITDDDNKDLTMENSEGLLYHVRSVFVPHGELNPLEGCLTDEVDQLKASLEARDKFIVQRGLFSEFVDSLYPQEDDK